jgi:hypothetical protein
VLGTACVLNVKLDRYPAATCRKPAQGVGTYPRAGDANDRYTTVTATPPWGVVANYVRIGPRAPFDEKHLCRREPAEVPPQICCRQPIWRQLLGSKPAGNAIFDRCMTVT